MKVLAIIGLALVVAGAYFYLRTSNSRAAGAIRSIFARGPKDPFQ